DRCMRCEPGRQVHGRAVEQRDALAQTGDAAAGIEMDAYGRGGGIVGGLSAVSLEPPGYGDRQALGGGMERGGSDRERQCTVLAGRRIGDDMGGAEDANGFQRQQFGIARADADQVQRTAHLKTSVWVGLLTLHCSTAMRGRRTRWSPTVSSTAV